MSSAVHNVAVAKPWLDARPPNDVTAPETLQFGSLLIDIVGVRVAVAGRDVAVTLAEFLILVALARQPHVVLHRVDLTKILKLRGSSIDPSPRAIDIHISRLRRKLSEAGYDCIKTMRLVGYRFVPIDRR